MNTLIGRLAILTMPFVPVMLSAVGAPQTSAPPTAVQRGQDSFRTYCADCHGAGAKGDGPAASSFTPGPPDLTTLATRNHGVFPAARVKATIRDKNFSVGHGAAQMKIWGVYFGAIEGDAKKADERIDDLVAFLQSIQSR